MLTRQQRVQRLGDFDIARLGGEVWNRLLEEPGERLKTLERWEAAVGERNLDWFVEEGVGHARDLEQEYRVRFRRAQLEIRATAFSIFADAVEGSVDQKKAALFKPVIRGYADAVVRELHARRLRVEAREALSSFEQEDAERMLRGRPILLADLELRLGDVDPGQAPRQVLHQVERSQALLFDARELEDKDEKLREQIRRIERQLKEGATRDAVPPAGNEPLILRRRSLRRVLRRQEHSVRKGDAKRNVFSLRLRLRNELGRFATTLENRVLLSRLAADLRSESTER